ncbi:DUF4392 domain-containing protein [Synergistes jonesii]|uniref:DUF4392 domain-containing protein n=1 Tax=Synergistes jonesii TaxID=2754 RepID=UPI00248F0F9B|nr:DUF4392 domain-containing protein [Synergistes jonesii]
MKEMTDAPLLPPAFAERLIAVVARDRGGRGVSRLSRVESWQKAARAFAPLRSVVIVSGFYVPDANAPETDGPGGAAVLARAFCAEGRRAEIWTDSLCLGVMKAAARAISFPERFVRVAPGSLKEDAPGGIIFTERPGRAADGRYYNFKKKDISEWSPPLDALAAEAAARGIATLGIGDGGNEAGMGCFYEELKKLFPEYSECFSVVKTDHALAVDVSNWGAYAFAAALSCVWGSWRGAEKWEELAMLEAETAAGAVDGISRLPRLTVDGFEISVQNDIISSLKGLCASFGVK